MAATKRLCVASCSQRASGRSFERCARAGRMTDLFSFSIALAGPWKRAILPPWPPSVGAAPRSRRRRAAAVGTTSLASRDKDGGTDEQLSADGGEGVVFSVRTLVGNKRRERARARIEPPPIYMYIESKRVDYQAKQRDVGQLRRGPVPFEHRSGVFKLHITTPLLTLYSSSKDCNNFSVRSVQCLCIGGPLPQRELPVLAAAAGLSVINPRVDCCSYNKRVHVSTVRRRCSRCTRVAVVTRASFFFFFSLYIKLYR